MDAFEGSLQVMDREAHWRLSHNVTQGQIGSFPVSGKGTVSRGTAQAKVERRRGPARGHRRAIWRKRDCGHLREEGPTQPLVPGCVFRVTSHQGGGNLSSEGGVHSSRQTLPEEPHPGYPCGFLFESSGLGAAIQFRGPLAA